MRPVSRFLLMVLMVLLAQPVLAAGPFNIRFPSSREGVDPQAVTVVGSIQHYRIKKGDDLLEIARRFGLGYTEIGAMYREWDPFLPPAGAEITIPSKWIVPNDRGNQIIVNTGEMRLYYFIKKDTQVYTFPIGMGVLDYRTPEGKFRVIQKIVNPTWHIPKELQAKYGMAEMPPGPDNPLGEYKLTLSWGDYGIHGTAMPWGVGRLVSHGCTRMYPEDIKRLFPMVPVGTTVEYIYEPAKIGFRHGHIYLSVHQDVYFKVRSMILNVLNLLEQRGVADQVNMRKVMQVVEEQNGMPVDVTKGASPIPSLTMNTPSQ
jgi:L,D-transpeptidase ErfK/SrfK